jgi:hypothetical protein
VQICEYFHLIWDDYEEMHKIARLSHPRVIVDTSGLSPEATEIANMLAERIEHLSPLAIKTIRDTLRAAKPTPPAQPARAMRSNRERIRT